MASEAEIQRKEKKRTCLLRSGSVDGIREVGPGRSSAYAVSTSN